MKEKILQLRKEGKTYDEIKKILGCSKSTISYHCGSGQKEKTRERSKKLKTTNPLLAKVDSYKRRNAFRESVRRFNKRSGNKIDKQLELNFSYKDVIDKLGVETHCYLSGEKINLLRDSNYHLDHKIPVCRNGDNTLDNLGVLHETVNFMKCDLLKEELIEWCKKILIYNGYKVE